MTADDRIFLYHLSLNHFTRGRVSPPMRQYLAMSVGVL